MRTEYDFTGGVRGRHYKALRQGYAVKVHQSDGTALVQHFKLEEGTVRPPHTSDLSVLEDWDQEGPDDPAGDEAALQDALVALEEYGDKPETWVKWEDFEAELDRAEAAGELPNGHEGRSGAHDVAQ
jgi:hypothetical protein